MNKKRVLQIVAAGIVATAIFAAMCIMFAYGAKLELNRLEQAAQVYAAEVE